MQPAERNHVPMSHETGHNSTVSECNLIPTWGGGLIHRTPETRSVFYSALAIAEFTASISAPKSLPSVPLFL